MGFFDLFRPKWKHSRVEVRLEAVRQLGADEAALLAQVARQDQDVRVRRVALKKIDDPRLLGELAERDPDESLRKDAGEKAAELLLSTALSDGDEAASLAALERLPSQKAIAEAAKRAAIEAVRRAALARLDDEKAIAEVARRAEDPHLRRQAVERLSDPALLREIAIVDSAKEVGLAALEKIDDAPALETILKKTRSKTVRAAAKERLEALRAKEAPKGPGGLTEAKRRSRQALLCRTVEEAAASDDWDHAQAAIEASRTQWIELGIAPGDEPFQKRFDRAIVRFNLRREEHAQKLKAQARAEAQRARAVAEETERRETTKEEDAARAEEDRKLAEVAAEARKVEEERRQAERARRAEEKAHREAEKAAENERRDREAAENLRRFEEVSARLESLAATDDLKAAESALKRAQEVVQSGGPLPREAQAEAKARYQKAREKLVVRLTELKDAEDWKRWANVPRLEALCGKMDALVLAASAEGADLKAAAAELKTLQGEWKKVGAAPKAKSEALWKRFKAAGDQVYEKIKGQHQHSDEERAANLSRKEALCARVEELAKAPDAEMRWKETAETIKLLQEEWKGIGPVVTREQADAAWKRFREACDQFFDRRKAHFAVLDEERGANLKKLDELCARVEQLAAIPDAEINWKDTAERIKAAQAEWKAAGPAPKEQSEAVWKRFREACDRFFDRRKVHFDALDAERAENLKKKELLCEKVEALAAADDHEAALAETRKLQAEWKTIGAAPKDVADAVWDRFRTGCDAIFDRGRKAPEPEPAAPAASVAAQASSRFENRLPLAGVAEKLAAAATEWEALAEAPAPPVEKAPEKTK
ncbi:MAG TPA: DUF349 domain-containing protein [Polyangia bacterium]